MDFLVTVPECDAIQAYTYCSHLDTNGMKLTSKYSRQKLAWGATFSLVCVWVIAEVFLGRWGQTNLPIQRAINSYPNGAEVLFMGNSRVAAGIKPATVAEALSKDLHRPVVAYNFGLGSSPIGIHYLLLKHLIEKEKPPSVVIYGFVDSELTRADFMDDYNLSQASKLSDIPLLFEKSLHSIDSRSDFFLKLISRVYRYRFHIREVLSKFIVAAKPEVARINNQQNGFQDFRNIVRPEAVAALKASQEKSYNSLYLDPEQWRFEPSSTYLALLIQLCKQAGIQLFFVEMPVTKLHADTAYRSINYARYRSHLKNYLSAEGVGIVSLGTSMPDVLIPDTMHLSADGATQFSELLLRSPLRLPVETRLTRTESR